MRLKCMSFVLLDCFMYSFSEQRQCLITGFFEKLLYPAKGNYDSYEKKIKTVKPKDRFRQRPTNTLYFTTRLQYLLYPTSNVQYYFRI